MKVRATMNETETNEPEDTRVPDAAATLHPFHIAYLPYLFDKKISHIECGPVTCWNFKVEAGSRVASAQHRERMAAILRENTRAGKPIEDIWILSTSGKECYELSDRDETVISETRLLLFLSFLAQSNISAGNNAGMCMVTSENFSLIHNTFDLSRGRGSYVGGGIVRVTSGGRTTSYEAPLYVIPAPMAQLDCELLKRLLLLRNRRPRLFRRVVRAAHALLNGYYNSPEVSDDTRILSLARAFEILLDLPEKQPRKHFKALIGRYSSGVKHRTYSYMSARGPARVKEQGTRPVIWADRFYMLRNKIIHGDALRDADYRYHRQSHVYVATWFFLLALKSLLNEQWRQPAFHDRIPWKRGQFKYDAISGRFEALIRKSTRRRR